jgi:hypothetical protein
MLAPVSGPAQGQNEATLRRAFEGQSVVVRIDMPGTSSGVNVYPDRDMPVDFPDLAAKLKRYGTALTSGDRVMVTKVKVKNDLIEFQLGGGGYGTFGDEVGGSVSHTDVGKTAAERALEDSIKHASSGSQKQRMQRSLDELRSTRERENARARAEAAQAEEVRQANLLDRRRASGSRFNIRYQGRIPHEAVTPDGLRAALSRYVDFDEPGEQATVTPPAGSGIGGLRKGLSLEEVEQLLGPAATATESDECSLRLLTRTYRSDGQRTLARFVSGVLVEYTVTPD